MLFAFTGSSHTKRIDCLMMNYHRKLVARWGRRLRLPALSRRNYYEAAFVAVLVLLSSVPVGRDAPFIGSIKGREAQLIVNDLRGALSIPNEVQVVVVAY